MGPPEQSGGPFLCGGSTTNAGAHRDEPAATQPAPKAQKSVRQDREQQQRHDIGDLDHRVHRGT